MVVDSKCWVLVEDAVQGLRHQVYSPQPSSSYSLISLSPSSRVCTCHPYVSVQSGKRIIVGGGGVHPAGINVTQAELCLAQML